MTSTKLKILALILIYGAYANAQIKNGDLHTEDNELVCQLDDFMETKLFIDSDFTQDGEIGKLSSKILEMPTKNAFANNYKLFQVELVKVSRSTCVGCENTQIILYKSDGVNDIINKLEVTSSKARVTRNVNTDGEPLNPSFVDEGTCQPNEPE
jgi:hypothetical protein